MPARKGQAQVINKLGRSSHFMALSLSPWAIPQCLRAPRCSWRP